MAPPVPPLELQAGWGMGYAALPGWTPVASGLPFPGAAFPESRMIPAEHNLHHNSFSWLLQVGWNGI